MRELAALATIAEDHIVAAAVNQAAANEAAANQPADVPQLPPGGGAQVIELFGRPARRRRVEDAGIGGGSL